jgi:hypothetical protein
MRLLGRECEGLAEAFNWFRRWLSCITWSCSRDLCSSRRNRSRSSSRSFIIFCNRKNVVHQHSHLIDTLLEFFLMQELAAKHTWMNTWHRTDSTHTQFKVKMKWFTEEKNEIIAFFMCTTSGSVQTRALRCYHRYEWCCCKVCSVPFTVQADSTYC